MCPGCVLPDVLTSLVISRSKTVKKITSILGKRQLIMYFALIIIIFI